MPTVYSTIIGSLVIGYYEFVKKSNIPFRIGLNMSSTDLLYDVPCSSSGSPGCVDATYSSSIGGGSMSAQFTATFTPSSSYTLTKISMVAHKPNFNWFRELGLIDLDNLTIQITGNTQYTITITNKITYPISI